MSIGCCLGMIVTLCLLVTACGPLIPLPGEEPKRYTLSYLEEKKQPPLIRKHLLVEVPSASIILDSQRVAVIPAIQQINYFANMEWSDRLPLVIQESLTYSLQNQYLFYGVTRRSDGIIPDQSLRMDIRKFYIDQTTSPKAEVEYFVQLIDITTRNEIAGKTFTSTVNLPEELTADTIVGALDQANREIARDLEAWLKIVS